MSPGKGFAREAPVFPPRLRDQAPGTIQPAATLHRAVTGGTTTAVAKPQAKRNRALLDMARGRPCLLRIPCICNCQPQETVACHSNLSIHGKAGARKADDQYSVWGGRSCHEWLDRGRAPADVKALAFTMAHLEQVRAWKVIAADPKEPERFRKAAEWALAQLNALPARAPLASDAMNSGATR